MTISIPKFVRILDLSLGVHDDADAHPSVKRMYEDVLFPPATTFGTAHAVVPVAESNAKSAHRASKRAIKAVDLSYRVARSVMVGRYPDAVVPGTLSEQPTDTDRKLALEELRDAVQGHHGEPWADEILAGPFGTLVPDAIAKIGAYLVASSALSTAIGNRSAAMEAAYPAFLSFKDAVRQAHGTGSSLYRRLRLRVRGTPAATPDPPVVGPTPVVTSTAPVALESPNNGAAH